MTEPKRPPAPRGLGIRGRRFWRDINVAYTLRPDELILLESVCKCVDLVADLEVAMADQPLTVKGSMGQEREHPLLSEIRQQRGLINRTLAQLKLPDLVTGKGVEMNKNREAAMARWRHGQ